MYLNVQSKQDLNSHRKLMGKNILFAYLKKIIKKNIYCTCMIWKLSFSNRLVQMIYFWFHKTQNTLVLTFYKFEALFQKCGYYSRESLMWGSRVVQKFSIFGISKKFLYVVLFQLWRNLITELTLMYVRSCAIKKQFMNF